MGKVREVLLDCKDKVQGKRPAPERIFLRLSGSDWRPDHEDRTAEERHMCFLRFHRECHETLTGARTQMNDGDVVYEYQLVAKYRCKTERE